MRTCRGCSLSKDSTSVFWRRRPVCRAFNTDIWSSCTRPWQRCNWASPGGGRQQHHRSWCWLRCSAEQAWGFDDHGGVRKREVCVPSLSMLINSWVKCRMFELVVGQYLLMWVVIYLLKTRVKILCECLHVSFWWSLLYFYRNIGPELDMIHLSLFGHRFMSIAEQMGRTLQRTAISTNIKVQCVN